MNPKPKTQTLPYVNPLEGRWQQVLEILGLLRNWGFPDATSVLDLALVVPGVYRVSF